MILLFSQKILLRHIEKWGSVADNPKSWVVPVPAGIHRLVPTGYHAKCGSNCVEITATFGLVRKNEENIRETSFRA